jgi:hypothetical protein
MDLSRKSQVTMEWLLRNFRFKIPRMDNDNPNSGHLFNSIAEGVKHSSRNEKGPQELLSAALLLKWCHQRLSNNRFLTSAIRKESANRCQAQQSH